RGSEGAPRERFGLGLPAADADGKLRRTDAAPRPVAEKALHATVLERVEGDQRQPAALAQDVPRRRERAVERGELVVHRDPQCLEGPLCGMAAAEAVGRGNGGADRVDQLRGGVEGPAASDLAGDRARVALLAVFA